MRIKTQANRLWKNLAILYERSGKDKAEFWREFEAVERYLTEESSKRPLALMQIERMFGVAQTKLMRLL